MERRENYTLSRTKQQKIAWIECVPPEAYACELYNLDVTVAEALEVMSTIVEMGWKYQERVIIKLIHLKEGYDV